MCWSSLWDIRFKSCHLFRLVSSCVAGYVFDRYRCRTAGQKLDYITNDDDSAVLLCIISLQQDQIALCDRNCHKSIEQGLVVTGAIPQYMIPTRNKYGIIGPILPKHLTPEVRQKG